jgi:hypothetical protein
MSKTSGRRVAGEVERWCDRAALPMPKAAPPARDHSLNVIFATWSSLLVEMSGVKSTLGPTRV